MAKTPGSGPLKLPFPAAKASRLEGFCADQWGFLRLSVTAGQIAGEYISVAKNGKATRNKDTFST
jgi:hypothetical protein